MSNLYNIGVRMTMYENVSPMVTALAHHFLNLHHTIDRATAAAWRFRQAVIGAGMAFVGYEGLKAVGHMITAGAELNKIQTQMAAASWNQKEIAEATANAWKISAKYQSIGVGETLEMQKEMGFVLGDKQEAIHMAETMARLQVSMQGTLGLQTASTFSAQIMAAIRAGELTGNSMKPENFARYLEIMVKALNASGGTVMPRDYFMATKYGRASALNWSDRFMGEVAPTIIQEVGASTMGTAFMSLYQAVVGGVMKNSAIAQWDRLGLLDRSKWNPDEVNADGTPKRFKPGGFKDSRMLMSDPDIFFEKKVLPAMIEHGIITASGLNQVIRGNLKDGEGKQARLAITEFAATLFGNRNAQAMADVLMLQIRKLRRDAERVRGSMGMESAEMYQAEQWDIVMEKVSKQWHRLVTAMGAPNVDNAIGTLQALANIFTGMGSLAVINPGVVQAITGAVVGLFGALAVGGLAWLGAAAVGVAGALPLMIGAIVGAFAALMAVNWDSPNRPDKLIGRALKQAKEMIFGSPEYVDEKGGFHARKKGIGEAIQGIISEFIAKIASIPAAIAGGIQAMAAAIAAKISAALGAIGGALGIGGGVQKQSFTPPAGGGKPIITRTTLNVDGRRLAEATSYHIARGSQHVRAAANYDGIRAQTPVDYSFA